jgi:hypothetical protein
VVAYDYTEHLVLDGEAPMSLKSLDMTGITGPQPDTGGKSIVKVVWILNLYNSSLFHSTVRLNCIVSSNDSEELQAF